MKTLKECTPREVRAQLYQVGVICSKRFLKANKLSEPTFVTYAETDKMALPVQRVLRIALTNPLVGGLTAFYKYGHVVVNVPVTALPVDKPAYRSWSYPGWKTDRTAVGVVAHETGHYVEQKLQERGILKPEEHGPEWRELARREKVSGYEPRPSEAWAESMRLFILNPYLLKFACPNRYAFIRRFLKPSENRTWRAVLLDHPAYVAAGERWIGTR